MSCDLLYSYTLRMEHGYDSEAFSDITNTWECKYSVLSTASGPYWRSKTVPASRTSSILWSGQYQRWILCPSFVPGIKPLCVRKNWSQEFAHGIVIKRRMCQWNSFRAATNKRDDERQRRQRKSAMDSGRRQPQLLRELANLNSHMGLYQKEGASKVWLLVHKTIHY